MLRVAGIVLAACLAGTPLLADQQLPDATLRAAFLFNFARFTEWPVAALAPGAPLNICVDDQDVFTALREAVQGKLIGDHAVTAMQGTSSSDARRCHVACVRRLPAQEAVRLFAELADAHVFTVGEDAAALSGGAVAHFFIEDRRLRFAVSLPHASRAGIQLSSRLLSLAVIHKEPDADASH